MLHPPQIYSLPQDLLRYDKNCDEGAGISNLWCYTLYVVYCVAYILCLPTPTHVALLIQGSPEYEQNTAHK